MAMCHGQEDTHSMSYMMRRQQAWFTLPLKIFIKEQSALILQISVSNYKILNRVLLLFFHFPIHLRLRIREFLMF